MECLPVKGQGEAPAAVARAGASCFAGSAVWVSVSLRRAVSLIFAGWLPQDGAFRLERFRLSSIERGWVVGDRAAHSSVAGHSSRCHRGALATKQSEGWLTPR